MLNSSKRRKPNWPLGNISSNSFKRFAILGGRLLSSSNVAVHVSVPLHNQRHEGCSSFRTWFKDFIVQNVLMLNDLGRRNTKLVTFFRREGGLFFYPLFSPFPTSFSFGFDPLPLGMVIKDARQIFYPCE